MFLMRFWRSAFLAVSILTRCFSHSLERRIFPSLSRTIPRRASISARVDIVISVWPGSSLSPKGQSEQTVDLDRFHSGKERKGGVDVDRVRDNRSVVKVGRAANEIACASRIDDDKADDRLTA